MSRPTPKEVPWDRGFWKYAAEGVLSAQRCQACSRLQFYPKPVCSTCMSVDMVFEPLSGRGTVYSFTIVRRPEHPDFVDEAPYAFLDVQLEEGIRLVSRLADEKDAEGLAIGDALQAVMKPVGDGSKHLPYFVKVR